MIPKWDCAPQKSKSYKIFFGNLLKKPIDANEKNIYTLIDLIKLIRRRIEIIIV